MRSPLFRAVTGLRTPRCPYCKSIEFRGVGLRNSLERFLSNFLHPYRCDFCGRHFFLFRWQAPLSGTA